MTLESLLRKIDIRWVLKWSVGRVGELGGLGGALVHGGGQCDERVVGLGQDATALFNVVAVEANHERLVGGASEHGECADDALGDRVTRGDAAEDVHENSLDLRVTEDDVEAGSHDLSGCSASDVEEVGRLDVAEVFAGVGDNVE